MKLIMANHRERGRGGAFTLIEIMIVVAIIGLIAAMGLPSLAGALRKEGMRKAISDITETCATARANAIFKGQPVGVVFYPKERKFAATSGIAKGSGLVAQGTLPSGVTLEALGINSLDFTASDEGIVNFYPDGTCDEMVLVLHSRDEWEKITLEYATGMPVVSSVDK